MGAREGHPRKATARAWRPESLLVLMLAACGLVFVLLPAAPAYALDPVNPVTVPVGGHPANSGFLAFVEGDVSVTADESEGTMAMGGDLIIGRNYNIAAGSPPAQSTFIAPGDVRQTFLYVGGGVQWPAGGVSVFIENGGFTKIADTTTYDAFNVDNNGATVNYRIVPEGQPYTSSRFIDGRTPLQTPASIETPVPSGLIDIPAAFATYRGLTQEMAACPATVQLTSPDPPFEVLDPIDPGDRGVLTLTPGQTNVLNLSAEDLNDLAEITYATPPTVTTPLLINVTGTTFNGDIPNQAGIGGSQAPYILWNFPDATEVTVTSGATLEGTLYAPNAALTWLPSQNIEGNIIAAEFSHGPRPTRTAPRELHDFPFAATLSCAADAPSAELTLVKVVVNDDGGTADAGDWTLTADGPTPVNGPGDSPDVVDQTVDPGDYDLSESGGPPGYTAGDWVCDGGTFDGTTLTLADGDDVTCTITNDDVASDPSPSATATTISPSPGTSPSATGGTGGTGTDPADSSDLDPSGALPDTGGPSWVWLLLALAALLGGTALLRSSRARPGQDADT